MHEPCKSNDILCKNTLDIKKVRPSKVVITGSECMNRLVTTRSDITIQPRGLAY